MIIRIDDILLVTLAYSTYNTFRPICGTFIRVSPVIVAGLLTRL